ncbi:MAG: hypothetical protein B6244_10325 [Candidatus Cloacimonetes bacterium 4572_55]|nr:MAG: hypothetical protein B6244_10325 [Candidatus Cloacimonetes bacterium 4572_55]
MKQKILFFSIMVSFFITFIVSAPNASFATKYAGEFLSLGVGGRALGMGGAYVAMKHDATLAYWNPAGLGAFQSQELALMHSERFGDLVNYDYIGFSRPFDKSGKSAIAVTLIRLGVDDIPFTEELDLIEPNESTRNGELDAPGEYVIYDEDKIIWESDSETALFFSYGHRMDDQLSVGGSLKLVRKSIGEYNANGFGFDLGMQYQATDHLTIGANIQDATTTLLLWNKGGERESISPTIKTGVAWIKNIGFFSGRISATFDVDTRFEGRDKAGSQYTAGTVSFDTHFGFEYFYRNALSLRFGPSAGDLSAGAGFIIDKLRFDYAFIGHNDLGDTHRVSGSIRF